MPRPGGEVIGVYRDLDLGQHREMSRFRSWKRAIPGVSGQSWRTSFGKGWFQGNGAGPATEWGIWNPAIPGGWGMALLEKGHFAPWRNVWTDDSSRRTGRWFFLPWVARPGSPYQTIGCLGGRVPPFRAQDFPVPAGGHRRVEESGLWQRWFMERDS